jgi:hypothetical protein
MDYDATALIEVVVDLFFRLGSKFKKKPPFEREARRAVSAAAPGANFKVFIQGASARLLRDAARNPVANNSLIRDRN